MKETVTIAALVLDASASMTDLKDSVISGVNEYIDSLKQDYEDSPEHGKILFSLVTFCGGRANQKIDLVHNLVDIREVPHITAEDYKPDGQTPYFDAVGYTIEGIDQFLEGKIDKTNPKNNGLINFMKKNKGKEIDYKVILITQTDGEENSSKKITTKADLKKLITEHEARGNWTVVFLGADLDATGEGMSLGVARGNTYQYKNTGLDTQRVYRGASLGVSAIRGSGMMRSESFSSYIPPEVNITIETPKTGAFSSVSGDAKFNSRLKDELLKNIKRAK